MVGDPIFLIGKDEVRYYGMLSQVNEADRTITLEQARCLGTEGRIGNPVEEIPPSNTIFELIRFRADEVKHVEFVADSASTVPAAPSQAAPASAISNAASTYQPVDASVQNQQQQQAYTAPARVGQSQASSSTGARAPAQTSEYRAQSDTYQGPSEKTTGDSGGYQGNYQNRQGGGYQRGGYSQRGGRGGYNHRGNGPRRGGYQGRGGHQGNRYGQNRRVEVPESDFDFESSNSKLNKGDLAKEFAKLNVKVNDNTDGFAEASANAGGGSSVTANAPSSDAAVTDSYVPKKSFFDDISSEVKERTQMQDGGLSYEEKRSRMNAERQQNYETFGQTSVDPNRHRYNRYNNNRGRGGGSGYYNQDGHSGNSSWRGGRGGRGGYHRGRGNYNNSHGYRNPNAPGSYSQQRDSSGANAGNTNSGSLVESGAQA
ncbi:hypothetical protein IW140_000950 [Coemansia sp. RSA 1813]|nr:hypothetical protein EV178_004824 [Coemansia sp. RSA 1646]KAJ1773380.1 hypothetical protein LPJ74_000633 [Coemansia sp. RSA 1843]KAJ2091598.1 hypothetical protein IW138_001826 [Coemansia sp. RSA 986]KAJ2212385.1 hypothetical protein EV179_004710 [Coemansia sp. RSA 487]KAJ2572201.1 hypothetical protein IW140_000950 [Coemansia sp. RSA 1813]